MKRMKRPSEEGAAAVEFALVLPLLLLVLMGICEFGIALYRQAVITNASREGARVGIVIGAPRPSDTEIRASVDTYLTSAGLDPAQASVNITGAQGLSGQDLTVRVQYPYTFLVLHNLVPGLGAALNLNAQTVMQLE